MATCIASWVLLAGCADEGSDADEAGDGDGDGDLGVCGDGVVEGFEECDDGNLVDTDDCLNACALAVCGDGAVQTGVELCDDGNLVDSDGCLASCEPAVCGDGVVWIGFEDCDDGDLDDHDACLDSCTAAVCGDGIVLAGVEACDDGNTNDGDGCTADCAEIELYSRCVGEGEGSCEPVRILYFMADDDATDHRFMTSMLTNGPVDYMDARTLSPILSYLEHNYDCVFTYRNSAYADEVASGAALRDFVDGGGNVVLGLTSGSNVLDGLAGTPIGDPGYCPVTSMGLSPVAPNVYSGDGTSALYTGVAELEIYITDVAVAVQGDGVADGTYDSGEIAAAYRPDFKVVYINGAGNPSLYATGDWPRLIANACSLGFVQ